MKRLKGYQKISSSYHSNGTACYVEKNTLSPFLYFRLPAKENDNYIVISDYEIKALYNMFFKKDGTRK